MVQLRKYLADMCETGNSGVKFRTAKFLRNCNFAQFCMCETVRKTFANMRKSVYMMTV